MDSKRKMNPKSLIHVDHLYSISVNEIRVLGSFDASLSIIHSTKANKWWVIDCDKMQVHNNF